MSNVVPQLPNFNRGAWKQSEEYIRKAYPLHQVIKGCIYKDIYKGILDIPIACWYKIYKGNILVEEKTLYQYTSVSYNIRHAQIYYPNASFDN
jgi:DNA/RNA endonuclease G (NUC1)